METRTSPRGNVSYTSAYQQFLEDTVEVWLSERCSFAAYEEVCWGSRPEEPVAPAPVFVQLPCGARVNRNQPGLSGLTVSDREDSICKINVAQLQTDGLSETQSRHGKKAKEAIVRCMRQVMAPVPRCA